MSYTIPDFPVLDAARPSLIKLNWFNKLVYDARISSFNRLSGGKQPGFYISNESWQLLAEGKQKDEFGHVKKWIDDENYEIYAFVFCIAYDVQLLNGPFLTNFKHSSSFLRIRTILKKKAQLGTSDRETEVLVETDRIAFLDIRAAMAHPGKDCLRFINGLDTGNPAHIAMKTSIDQSILVSKMSQELGVPFNRNIPEKLTTRSGLTEATTSKIENEGMIIGKSEIWDQILNNRYEGKGSNVFIAFCQWSKKAALVLKINDSFASTIPCPKAPACHPAE
jgi:hypothetical protein